MNKLRRWETACAFALCALLCTGFAMPAFATGEPVVIYDASTQRFEYENADAGEGYQNPDVFPTFKALVPGDTLTQTILVQVENLAANKSVAIYLSAENPTADYITFNTLDEVDLTVQNSAGQDITGSLAQPLLLGTFSQNGATPVRVSLDLPTSVGNEVAALEGSIDWVFQAEENLTNPDILPNLPDLPDNLLQTGQRYGLLIGLVCAGVLCLLLAYAKRKPKK